MGTAPFRPQCTPIAIVSSRTSMGILLGTPEVARNDVPKIAPPARSMARTLSSSGANTVTLYFPEPTQPRVIEYPDEDGRLLTTVSNYSTMTAVATLVKGSLLCWCDISTVSPAAAVS